MICILSAICVHATGARSESHQPAYYQHTEVQDNSYYEQNFPQSSATVAEQCSDEPSALVFASRKH